jgi:hypothetical protein
MGLHRSPLCATAKGADFSLWAVSGALPVTWANAAGRPSAPRWGFLRHSLGSLRLFRRFAGPFSTDKAPENGAYVLFELLLGSG